MKSSVVKYILSVSFILFFLIACEDAEQNEPKALSFCDTPVTTVDSLIIAPYHLYFNALISSDTSKTGLLELIDLNQNGIDTLENLSISQIKIKGGGNCFETSAFTSLSPTNGISLEYSNVPSWAPSVLNQAIIQLKLDGITYYLEDPSVNN